MSEPEGVKQRVSPDKLRTGGSKQVEDDPTCPNGQTTVEGLVVTANSAPPEQDIAQASPVSDTSLLVTHSCPGQAAGIPPGTAARACAAGMPASVVPVEADGGLGSISVTTPVPASHTIVTEATNVDGAATTDVQTTMTQTKVGQRNRRDRSSARLEGKPRSVLCPSQRSSMDIAPNAPLVDDVSGAITGAAASSRVLEGEAGCSPGNAGSLSDCSIAMLTQFRDNRLIVFQRGRSCKAHPFKDTGSRDGFITLSRRAVVQAAHNLRSNWDAEAALLQFHQLLPELQPGVDPTEQDVYSGAVRSMGCEPPSRRRGASRGSSVHITASGETIKTAQGPKAPLVNAIDASELSDLQALLVGLAKPDTVHVDGVPVIRIGLCSVDSLGVPSCGSWAGSLVQPNTRDSPASLKPLSDVAVAAGLSQATVDAAMAPTWGADTDADTLALQDDAFIRIAQRAWPTAATISPAAKRTRGAMLYGPSWPKIHWRVREACWTSEASQGSPQLAVIPFTIAAMNHTGQPTHRPPVSWLSIAAVCALGPPVAQPVLPQAESYDEPGSSASSSSSSSSSSSASASASASAVELSPPQVSNSLRSTPFISAVSQPFALVSCNDKPRKIESRNNRRLAFMPKLEGPEGVGTGTSSATGKLQTLTKAFINTVTKYRQQPAMELASVRTAMGVILPRRTLKHKSNTGNSESGAPSVSARGGTQKRGRGVRGTPKGRLASEGRTRGLHARSQEMQADEDFRAAGMSLSRPGDLTRARNGQFPQGSYILPSRTPSAFPGAAIASEGISSGSHIDAIFAPKRARPGSLHIDSGPGLHRNQTMSSASASSGLSSESNVAGAFQRATGGDLRRMESGSTVGNQALGPASYAMIPQDLPPMIQGDGATSQALSAQWVQRYGMPMQGTTQLTPQQQVALGGPVMLHQWALPVDMASAASAASIAFSSSASSSSVPSSALLAAGQFPGLAPDWSYYRQGPSFTRALGTARSAAPGSVMSGGSGAHSAHLYELQYARETMAGQLQLPAPMSDPRTGTSQQAMMPYPAMAPVVWPGVSVSAPLETMAQFQQRRAGMGPQPPNTAPGHAPLASPFANEAADTTVAKVAGSLVTEQQPIPSTAGGAAVASHLRASPAFMQSQPMLLSMKGAAPASRSRLGADGTTSTAGASEDGAGSGSVLSLSAPEAAGLATGDAATSGGRLGGPRSTGGMSLPSSHIGGGQVIPISAPQHTITGQPRVSASQAWSDSNPGVGVGGAGSAAVSWGSAPPIMFPLGLMRDAALAMASRHMIAGAMPFGSGVAMHMHQGQGAMPLQGSMIGGGQSLSSHSFPILLQQQQQQQQQQHPSAITGDGTMAGEATKDTSNHHHDPSQVELTRATSSRLQRRRW